MVAVLNLMTAVAGTLRLNAAAAVGVADTQKPRTPPAAADTY